LHNRQDPPAVPLKVCLIALSYSPLSFPWSKKSPRLVSAPCLSPGVILFCRRSTGILPGSPTPGGCFQRQRPGESGWDLFWFRASVVRIRLHSI